ncbi:MAG: hypothetical protein PF795_13070 [Kiritimatiellae bacterium]|jgi:hypothetical protein|nr:hypothetical protein [Kiritimatiellia bacterium]
MAFPSQLIIPGLVCLLLNGCQSTPVPTGDTLVSVSWVNATPSAIPYIQTTLCDSETASLEHLPGYSEVPVATRQSLTQNCRVETTLVQNGETVSLGTGWLESPTRTSKTREYNLRVHLQASAPPRLQQEPVQNLRARMSATGKIE